MKDWKTTVGSIVGVALMAAGIIWPDKVDPESQVAANAAIALVLQGIGGLVVVITGWFAKDP